MQPDLIEAENEAGEDVEGLAGIQGSAAAAILLMLLEEGDAASILKHFEADEVKQLAKAMYDSAQASEVEIEEALERFVIGSRSVTTLGVGANERIRTVINEAVGNIRADNILAAVAPQSSAASLEMLRWMEVPAISRLIANEHAQVGAIILSVLLPDIAAQALETVDDAMQMDLIYRAARLSSVSAAAIEDLEYILSRASGAEQHRVQHKIGGPTDVAKIMKEMPRTLSEKLIKNMKRRDRAMADTIEDEMFIFENLRELDFKSLGAVLRSADAAVLSIALKGTDKSMAERCLATMSARAADTIRDEIAEMGMVKRADVEDAQRTIMLIARQMAASGEIMLASKGEDYV